MVCRLGAALLATAIIFICSCVKPVSSEAQAATVLDTASELISRVNAPDWGYSVGVKKFFNSFTSYQFPNPFPPNQDPLSRLEFPIDQWFIGGAYAYVARSWSVELDSWVNINRDGRSKMQDSDWDDETLPFQKTVFSESNCRLNRGWLLDLKLSLRPELSIFKMLRPIAGIRYQDFSFTTHDGYQVGLDGHFSNLPGDGIDFDQTFYHAYLGAICDIGLNTSGIFSSLPTVDLQVVLDYALVTARNQDLHLLRSGQRITTENTSGHCWHLAATAWFPVRHNLKGRIEADFKKIVTNGAHQLTNSFFNIDFSFDGSRVWSDQFSVTASTELIF